MTRRAERGIRGSIVAVFVAGYRRANSGAIVNAGLGLAGAYLPAVIERRYDVEFRPWQRVYTEIAMLAHAVGMLGPYDETWWWDHVTHTLSATLLGGTVHAAARRRGRDPLPRVLAVVVGSGVLWELMEYTVHALSDRFGLEPVLIPYSVRDTLFDLAFDFLGAVLVLLFGDRLLRNFTRRRDTLSGRNL
ncbi:hypothetical protein Htur_3230 [Haloterrigena turkmenica DSM 5511]|uniref:Uncharacterized protein n=1 Tax=Haloterrigena turkmenica (strain ATCC 51198 / DSM 5511 / JCM 9101 / NCIMB 13204 / VKM B-1734 / 4k) TaxID=543526 RepID=D2RZQ5_HALTV|nr:hypothetical protein [Haloterrigena turkmenica]ADB62094.1 hypothetical protein Htur_3230 [Haloterrigena turkmenica DSM 5511]